MGFWQKIDSFFLDGLRKYRDRRFPAKDTAWTDHGSQSTEELQLPRTIQGNYLYQTNLVTQEDSLSQQTLKRQKIELKPLHWSLQGWRVLIYLIARPFVWTDKLMSAIFGKYPWYAAKIAFWKRTWGNWNLMRFFRSYLPGHWYRSLRDCNASVGQAIFDLWGDGDFEFDIRFKGYGLAPGNKLGTKFGRDRRDDLLQSDILSSKGIFHFLWKLPQSIITLIYAIVSFPFDLLTAIANESIYNNYISKHKRNANDTDAAYVNKIDRKTKKKESDKKDQSNIFYMESKSLGLIPIILVRSKRLVKEFYRWVKKNVFKKASNPKYVLRQVNSTELFERVTLAASTESDQADSEEEFWDSEYDSEWSDDEEEATYDTPAAANICTDCRTVLNDSSSDQCFPCWGVSFLAWHNNATNEEITEYKQNNNNMLDADFDNLVEMARNPNIQVTYL